MGALSGLVGAFVACGRFCRRPHARPHAPTCAHMRPHAPTCTRVSPFCPARSRFFPLVPVFSRFFPLDPVFSLFFLARSRFSFFSHNHPEVPTSAHMFHPFRFCCTCACGLLLGLWALLLGLGLWALARARALLRGWAGLVDGWAWRSCGLVGAFPGLRVLLGACGRLGFCWACVGACKRFCYVGFC